MQPRWRSFPLEQVNSEDEDWVFWDQSPDEARSLLAFLAAEAVRDQGEPLISQFVFNLLHAVHEEKRRVHEMDTIKHAAEQTPGLDVERMVRDMDRPELRRRIADDYQEGVERYGVFGTPTLLFPDGDPIFLKMSPPAPRDEAVSLFETIRSLSAQRPYVQELKKPRPPDRPA